MQVVVVVEDEPLLLVAIVDYLIDEDFTVLQARHADEAIAILALDPAVIHLLFTDVQMPGAMDGIALSHHVKKHWPWIGLLVTSAHTAPLAKNLPERCRFLRKPYNHARVV